MKNVRATSKSVLGFFVNPPGETVTNTGIIIPDDDGKAEGIKSRYMEIHSVGADTDVSEDLKPGDIVLVAHARWSRGIDVDDQDGRKIHSIDPGEILAIFDGSSEELKAEGFI